MNAKMANLVPELDSEYARFPMRRSRWLDVAEVTSKNEPCFVASAKDVGLKKNYIWGPGPKGFGYYHLLTRASYISLYARLTYECPVSCCSFSRAARKKYAEWDEVKRLVYFRSRAVRPDDGRAYLRGVSSHHVAVDHGVPLS